jgi:hypothetical protein
MEQFVVKDVDQLIDTMVPNREINQHGGIGNVRIDEVELAVCATDIRIRIRIRSFLHTVLSHC